MDPTVLSVLSGVAGGIVTGAMSFAAIRVELRYMRRDLDDLHNRLRKLEGRA